MTRRWIAFTLVLFGMTVAARRFVPGGPPTRVGQSVSAMRPMTVEDRIEAVLSAKIEGQRVFGEKSFRELFALAGTDGVSKLRFHSNDTIAIQAAWEEVVHVIPEEQGKRPYRPDQQKLDEFIGFLEGRGRLQLPEWWRELLRDTQAHRRRNIYYRLPKESRYHKAGVDSVRAPIGTTLVRQGASIVVRQNDDAALLPDDFVQQFDRFGNVSACFTATNCYVAYHNDVGYPFPLICLNRSDGRTVWEARVWGTWWGSSSGISRNWVAIEEETDRVVVFGASGTGLHAEVFQKDTGKEVFRFSTSY